MAVSYALKDRRPWTPPTHAKTKKERQARRAAALARYSSSPRGKYSQQKKNAKARGIPWEISFAEWCEVWETSGRWDDRGHFADGYVMARNGDVGPYKVGNVRIALNAENVAERNRIYFERMRRPGTWYEPNDSDYRHVHSAPDIDSGAPGPDVPF